MRPPLRMTHNAASSVTDIGGSKPPPYRWDGIERQNRCIFVPFACGASGRPPPTVGWDRKGKIVASSTAKILTTQNARTRRAFCISRAEGAFHVRSTFHLAKGQISLQKSLSALLLYPSIVRVTLTSRIGWAGSRFSTSICMKRAHRSSEPSSTRLGVPG